MYSGADSFMTGIFYSYPAEVQSFSLRAKGMAVWNTANQLTGLYNAVRFSSLIFALFHTFVRAN
jgi:hypothetical protein